jgi:hypothetical protein
MFTVVAAPAAGVSFPVAAGVTFIVAIGVSFPVWPPTGGMAVGVTFIVAAGVTFSVGAGPAPLGAATLQTLPVLVELSGPPTSFVST